VYGSWWLTGKKAFLVGDGMSEPPRRLLRMRRIKLRIMQSKFPNGRGSLKWVLPAHRPPQEGKEKAPKRGLFIKYVYGSWWLTGKKAFWWVMGV